MRSPKVILESVLTMLRYCVEKDNSNPTSCNQPLILYLVRFVVRVKSCLIFLIEHANKRERLRRAGAHCEAMVRGLATEDDAGIVSELRKCHKQLRNELESHVCGILMGWAKQERDGHRQLLDLGPPRSDLQKCPP